MPPRRGTPWVSRGSLLSDRIRPPSRSPQPTKSEKAKGKAKAATPEPPPRSIAVRKLDELLDGLRSSSTSNQQPKNETRKATTAQGAGASADRDGCFCQGTSASFFLLASLSYITIVARIHALSEYTPLCSSCGLILCALQPPHRPCPHCSAPLLTPSARAALLAQLEELRAHALEEEAEAREREAQELRLAEGAFPALSGGVGAAGVSTRGGGGGGAAGAASGGFGGGRGARGGGPGAGPGHRVLLVDSRTKRVKVESYSRSGSGGLESEDLEEDVAEAEAGIDERVPPPPREVEFVRVQRGPATRWVDLKSADGTAKYVALSATA
jgi:hypothetical protein